MPATVEIRCRPIRPGFSFMEITHTYNWKCHEPWDGSGVSIEYRGGRHWEKRQSWSEKADWLWKR